MSAMWKLEKDLCRCCHAEGSFKHLSDPCFLLGQEEIYSVMLKDCLDIKIVPMTGPLSDATYTICEACVGRLRDASNFKRQVQDCEQRFKEMYSKNMVKGFEVKAEPFEGDAAMKQESRSIDESDDDDEAFMKFDDELSGGDTSYEEHEEAEEMITVEIQGEPSKGKGKLKARRKTPNKRAKKEKPIKTEGDDSTEATASGEKKKGIPSNIKPEVAKYCKVKHTKTGTTYNCAICESEFEKFNQWHLHYFRDHLNKKRSPCIVCRTVLAPWQRWRHMEEHHGWEPPTCSICGKTFCAPYKVVAHMKQFHMGEKNHICKHCGKAFSRIQNLQQHMPKHSLVRDFKCDYCEKDFTSVRYLRLHMKLHLDDKKYVCSVCDKPYIQLSNLKWHIRKHHPDAGDESSNVIKHLLN